MYGKKHHVRTHCVHKTSKCAESTLVKNKTKFRKKSSKSTTQLSSFKKDVLRLHVMSSTWPIPPLPVLLKRDISHKPKDDTSTSFNITTVQIFKDAKKADNNVNTNSIIDSIIVFTQWNATNTSVELEKRVIREKDAVIL